VTSRSTFIRTLAAGILAAPLTTLAQQPARLYRIGVLANENNPIWESFRRGLRDLGYVEGGNVTIDWRYSDARVERFPALALELVQSKVDIIVASSTPAIRAAKQATSTIPIVMANSAYPDKSGLVESLARPGGNVTGLTNVGPDLLGKSFQVLKELAPKVSRVAVLFNPANPSKPWRSMMFGPLQSAQAWTSGRSKCVGWTNTRRPSRLSTRAAPMPCSPSAILPTSRIGNPLLILR
jgi:putative ABC transport system substrate-binding protein